MSLSNNKNVITETCFLIAKDTFAFLSQAMGKQ